MKIIWTNGASALYLRLAIAAAYLWEVADRIGLLGKPGGPHVGWGDWGHFVAYAGKVMAFLPFNWVPFFAVTASLSEAVIGLLLLFGWFTRPAAIGSGLLSLCFALAMAISFGIESPLGYSVFALSAASLLLARQPVSKFSVDHLLQSKKTDQEQQINKTAPFELKDKLVCLLILCMISATGLYGQQLVVKSNNVKIGDTTILLQALKLTGSKLKNMQMELVTFPPGAIAGPHRHTCPVFGYLIEGELESEFEHKRRIYRKGDSFYEKAYGLHSVARNLDPLHPAKLLVFFIANEHQPNTIHLKK